MNFFMQGQLIDADHGWYNTHRKDNQPLLQCTHHMCPVRIHWHLKLNYEKYWRAKIAITNFNYRLNYTQWTLVIQHPNLSNLTQVFSFDYKPLVPYQSISKTKSRTSIPQLGYIVLNYVTADDTGMFYGMKFYNDLLMEAGVFGNVQSEILLEKDKDTFSLRQGWAFPRKVYFNGDDCRTPVRKNPKKKNNNGDDCMLPPPDAYPFLPNSATCFYISVLLPAMIGLVLLMTMDL